MLELDVLLGDGRVVSCTPDNAHADLFFGFPNSYGTLGYALRVKAKTDPGASRTCASRIVAFHERRRIFRRAGKAPATRATPISSTARSSRREQLFITLGRFVDSAPYTSDYTYENIYYRSIAEKRRGLPHGARLPLALGHRLVLVLEERAGAERRSSGGVYGTERLGSTHLHRRSCAGTAASASRGSSSACSACIRNR